MTDEQIRIAIADFCGLFRIEPLRRETRKGKQDPNGVILRYCSEHHGGAAIYSEIPDYLNDLNAMHEAEKTLYGDIEVFLNDPVVYKRWQKYNDFLVSEFGCHATARQRALAFIKTISPS